MDDAERLSIQSSLTQLVYRFSYAIDHRQYEDLAQLFTEDCVFERIGQSIQGRAGILEAMANRHPNLTRHTITNLLFTRIERNEAEAVMYCANFVGLPEVDGLPVEAPFEPAVLEFTDLYRREEQGWLIHKRTAIIVIKPKAAAH